jgi:hypothetical protein
VGEAQKVEGLRLAKAALGAVRRGKAAELDQARLVRMQAQCKAFQPLPQIRQKPLGIGPVLKAGDQVVGVAHHDDVALGMAVSPLPRPEIEDVVLSMRYAIDGIIEIPQCAGRPARSRWCKSTAVKE